MKLSQVRELARRWVVEEASRIPGFQAAYTAGSTNWLPDGADLPATSDFDVMVVLQDPSQPSSRYKFRYAHALLEASYLGIDQLRSPESVLSDYHLAPSLRTAHILLDPSGHLTALAGTLRRDYAKRRWVRARCANARDKALAHLRAIHEGLPLHNLLTACLFGAGVTAHVLLVAGLRNPTVRARYVAVRSLLADYGGLEFHETLLELLGAAGMSRIRVERRLAALTEIFDAAAGADRTPLPFGSDLSGAARPIAIDGSRELIERGFHREAMFWIAVTHCRCQMAIALQGPAPRAFVDSLRDLAADLGMASFEEVRRRRAEVERALPRVWQEAERIVAANREIEDG